MARLSQCDLRALLAFLQESYAIRDLTALRTHLLTGLPRLVPAEITAYNEINLRTQHNLVLYDRPEILDFPDSGRIFDRHIPEHPLIAYHRRTGAGAVKISDFLSTTQFHRLGLYGEFFRRIGIEDQMAMLLSHVRPVVIGIALNRNRRTFRERDRLLLDLARPHLLQAYRNADAWTQLTGRPQSSDESVLGRSDLAVIVLSNPGQAPGMSSKARQWLTQYFSGPFLPPDGFPEFLQRWIRQQRELMKDCTDVPPCRTPLVVERGRASLVVRLISDESQSLLLLEQLTAARQPKDIAGLGLTAREADVLRWVAQGKTNIEISILLAISPRTVQKHLEHIFDKLGVETRTGAAAKAMLLPRS